MSINIRFPNITAFNEREQIAQIKSYLHQLVQQLNNELPNLGSGDGSTKTASSSATYEVQGGELSYYELRSLVVQELQKVEKMMEDLEQARDNGEFDGVSATHSWNGTVLTITSASGTSSADLKGEKGDTGEQGIQGVPGEKGDTGSVPVYGEDFFLTEDDKTSIATELAKIISFSVDEETGDLYYEYPDSEVIEDENTNNEVEE